MLYIILNVIFNVFLHYKHFNPINMKKYFVLLSCLAYFFTSSYSQRRENKHYSNDVVTNFYDSLAQKSSAYYANYALWNNLDTIPQYSEIPNPDLYKLFVPPTYYQEPIEEISNIDWSPSMYNRNRSAAIDSILCFKNDSCPSLPYDNLEKSKATNSWVNKILMNVYLNRPELVLNNEAYFKNLKFLDDNKIVKRPKKEDVISLLEPEAPVENLNEGELIVVRPNFWTHKGNGYAQFTQHYISDNWYKGGESTNALLSGLILEANYNDRQKIQFDNRMEIKLGFITAPSDTVHKYKTNADLFRITSKLGVQAHKNWYYTLGLDFKTQFFANYKTNTNDLISNILSPAQMDLTLGMDFKKSNKNYTLSLLTSPFAYTFIFIKDNDRIINTTTFNVKDGDRTANLFGSKFTGTLQWKMFPSVVWDSKLEYFTTYNNVIANWENTFNFVLNRYLSTKLFVHARFDDGVALSGNNHSYFQIQELLSFGLNYKW